MKKKYNALIIGFGFWGPILARNFQSNLYFNVHSICDSNSINLNKAKNIYPNSIFYKSYKRALDNPEINIVIISTPTKTHYKITKMALSKKKHILCEKPLANTLAESRKMLDAVQRNQVPHMICHNYRKVPAVTLAHQLINKGTLGQIRHFRGTYLQDWAMDPQLPLLWRFDKKKSGTGTLGDLGSHIIDLARFLVGEIRGVSALLETFIKERPLLNHPTKKGRVTVDDASLTLVRFANGAVGTIEASRFAPGHKNFNCFEINGSQGSLSFNLERLNELKLYLRKDGKHFQGFRDILVTEPFHPYMKWWPPGHVIGYEHTFVHVVYDLMQALSQNHKPTPSFLDGVQNQKVIDAIQHSAQSKKWIQIRPE